MWLQCKHETTCHTTQTQQNARHKHTINILIVRSNLRCECFLSAIQNQLDLDAENETSHHRQNKHRHRDKNAHSDPVGTSRTYIKREWTRLERNQDGAHTMTRTDNDEKDEHSTQENSSRGQHTRHDRTTAWTLPPKQELSRLKWQNPDMLLL